MARPDLVLVGRVTAAHGIRGDVKVHSYAESIELYRIGEGIELTLPDGSRTTLTIQSVKPHGRVLLMGLESVADRNQAEGLVGSSLFIDKSRLPVLDEDTYYWSDLVGLSVYDPTGLLLGRLDEVIPTPGNDVYVVKGNVEGQPRELLIPAIGDVVLSIDIAGKTMVVELPEGLQG
jgi:16S rRNA processing protein RimM